MLVMNECNEYRVYKHIYTQPFANIQPHIHVAIRTHTRTYASIFGVGCVVTPDFWGWGSWGREILLGLYLL